MPAPTGPPRVTAVGVVVPARNEEAHIEQCLRALITALDRLPSDVACAVCLVLDRCVDRTTERALAELTRLRTRAGDIPVDILPNQQPATIGALRDAGLRRALRLLTGRPTAATWLLSTDADTTVGRSWALDHLRYADRGADAVAGMADLDDSCSLSPIGQRRYARILAAGIHGNRHTHVYGANIGVRASAYLTVGGFPPALNGEDHELLNRLRAAGHRIVAPTDLRVRTSARHQGRAPSGLAELLRAAHG